MALRSCRTAALAPSIGKSRAASSGSGDAKVFRRAEQRSAQLTARSETDSLPSITPPVRTPVSPALRARFAGRVFTDYRDAPDHDRAAAAGTVLRTARTGDSDAPAECRQRGAAESVLHLALALTDALPAPTRPGHAGPARLLAAERRSQLGTGPASACGGRVLRRLRRRAGIDALPGRAPAPAWRAASTAAGRTTRAAVSKLSAEHPDDQLDPQLRHAHAGLRLARAPPATRRLQRDAAPRRSTRGDGYRIARLRPGAAAGTDQCRGGHSHA